MACSRNSEARFQGWRIDRAKTPVSCSPYISWFPKIFWSGSGCNSRPWRPMDHRNSCLAVHGPPTISFCRQIPLQRDPRSLSPGVTMKSWPVMQTHRPENACAYLPRPPVMRAEPRPFVPKTGSVFHRLWTELYSLSSRIACPRGVCPDRCAVTRAIKRPQYIKRPAILASYDMCMSPRPTCSSSGSRVIRRSTLAANLRAVRLTAN